MLLDPTGKQTASPMLGGAWMIDRQHSLAPYYSNAPAIELKNNPGAQYFRPEDYGGETDYNTNLRYGDTVLYGSSNGYSVGGKEGFAFDKTRYVADASEPVKHLMIGSVAAITAVMLAPVLVSIGSTEAVLGKAAVSGIGQLAVNRNLDLADMTADTFLVPGASGLVGGAVNVSSKNDFKIDLNTDANAILYNGATSILSGAMGSRFSSALGTIGNKTTKTAAEVMVNTPHNMVEQGLNNAYDERK